MSAIEPCLKPKEMASTSVEFLDSFETIDEEKDSDEESFHLFLEGDDELNKSDEKPQSGDTNKNNDEEKEKVNELTENEENCTLKETNSPVSNEEYPEKSELVEEEKSAEPEEKTVEPDENPRNSPIQTENTDTPQNNVIEDTNNREADVEDKDNTEENMSENQTETETKELTPAELKETNESPELEIENENKEKTCLQENQESETLALTESEDDILNKHVTETDTDDVEPSLDPSLEDSLLDEKDETSEDKTLTPTKFVTESEVTENTSEIVPDSESEKMIVDNEDISEVMEEDQVKSSEKQSESASVPRLVSEKCNDETNVSPTTFDTEEDLLDISMIKDSAQDDADIAQDALALEEENEDSDGNSGSNSKTMERVESVDESSNVENSDEDGKDSSSGKETTESMTDISQDPEKQNDIQDSSSDNTLVNDTNSDVKDSVIDEKVEENKIKISSEISDDKDTSEDISNAETNAKKRALSQDAIESDTKKRKLEEEKVKDDADAWDFTGLQSLISFSKFMTKNQLKHLTRADLEEFCIQKFCEAILHKSELGETNHQLKLHEQTIESLRKEQSILTKQIKDLETVNKKLMHEVKNHLGVKPLAPVKITRSVGLQVRINPTTETNTVKRRSSSGTIPKTPNSVQTPSPIVRSQRTVPSNAVTKSVQNSPQKPNTTPLLSQVLQNRNRQPTKTTPQNNTAIRTTPKLKPSPEKRAKPSGSFIDLTDEDDKKTNAKNQASIKTIVPQGLRINTVPKTSISSVLPSVVQPNTTQLMYVVQANSQIKQGLLTTAAGQQKAVLLNFQPQNGVINTLNNSAVSVLSKATTNAQLKPSSLLKVQKHPAPLPNPPQVQGPTDKILKAIPPKPVLSIRKTNTGIILQWRMPYDLGLFEGIASYQLYAYQETTLPPNTDMWRKVGDVKAMALPMACTLTQFADKNKYYFAVRPVDIHKRIGKFSNPEAISL